MVWYSTVRTPLPASGDVSITDGAFPSLHTQHYDIRSPVGDAVDTGTVATPVFVSTILNADKNST